MTGIVLHRAVLYNTHLCHHSTCDVSEDQELWLQHSFRVKGRTVGLFACTARLLLRLCVLLLLMQPLCCELVQVAQGHAAAANLTDGGNHVRRFRQPQLVDGLLHLQQGQGQHQHMHAKVSNKVYLVSTLQQTRRCAVSF